MFDEVSTAKFIELLVRATVELFLVGGALWFIFFRLGVRKHLVKLGRRRFVVLLILLLTWTSVQMVDRWQYFYPQPIGFYPVVRFAMYQIGEKSHVVRTYRFEGLHLDGSTTEMNMTEYFQSVGLPSLHTRMRALTDDLRTGDLNEREAARKELADYARGASALLASQDKPVPNEVVLYSESHLVHDLSLVEERVLARFALERDSA